MSATKKRKNMSGQALGSDASVVDAATTLFRAIYPDHAEELVSVTKALLAKDLVSMDVVAELIGADPKFISNEHLFAKLENPDHVLPTEPFVDAEVALSPGGLAARALGFMVSHCLGSWFRRAHRPIPEATLGDLVVRVNTKGCPNDIIMLCLLAQGVVDKGQISLEDLGVSLDDVWDLFPYELESRQNPLGALGSGHLVSLLRYCAQVVREINLNREIDTLATFESDFNGFIVLLRENIWKQMKVLKKRMKNKTVGELTDSDMKMLKILRKKNKDLGYPVYI